MFEIFLCFCCVLAFFCDSKTAHISFLVYNWATYWAHNLWLTYVPCVTMLLHEVLKCILQSTERKKKETFFLFCSLESRVDDSRKLYSIEFVDFFFCCISVGYMPSLSSLLLLLHMELLRQGNGSFELFILFVFWLKTPNLVGFACQMKEKNAFGSYLFFNLCLL